MAEMLTAKEMRNLLHVNRSTIYRMAEAGRLPAVKVGKQWRFPSGEVEEWLKSQRKSPAYPPQTSPSFTAAAASLPALPAQNSGLASLLPMSCVQLIQDTFADTLGAMLIVTDMQGNPITEVSKPCGLFQAVSQFPNALQTCIKDWAAMGETLNLEPKLTRSHLGLLGARGLIRVGTELKGMVIVGGIAPDNWPPLPEDVDLLAAEFGLPSPEIEPYLDAVFYLRDAQKTLILSQLQRIADIIAHIVVERITLVGKLNSIAQLVMQ